MPRLLQEGIDAWNRAGFFEAHEAWEGAWHSLRAAKENDAAHFVHGLILMAAAFENLKRGKVDGFRRQGAEGLWLIRKHEAAARNLALDGPSIRGFCEDGYLNAARRRDPASYFRESISSAGARPWPEARVR
ncbi:MAG: DUF309 domain-containing protein [Thermoplasmatota archaeon]